MGTVRDRMYVVLIIFALASAVLAFGFSLTPTLFAVTSNTITASVSVIATCYLTENVQTIVFGGTSGVSPAVQSPFNSVLYSDTAGNTNAMIYVYGTNWVYSSNMAKFGFGVANTVYGPSAVSQNALALTAISTNLNLPWGGSNTVYFAVNIPSGQPVNTYTQNIIAQVTC